MDFWLFLHILSAIVAFGVLFSQPMIARQIPDAGDSFARVGTYIQAPALVLLLLTGIARAYADSNGDIFKEVWISIAFTVWIAMAVVLFFLIKAHRSGSAAIGPLTGVLHLLLLVALWAMIWQPGLGQAA